MVPEEGGDKENETNERREEAESKGKRRDIQENKEVDMGEELKKAKENAMVEDKERVEEGEFNKRGESPIKALNKEEMKEDTHATPFGTPTLAELAKLVDVVVEDTIEKALK